MVGKFLIKINEAVCGLESIFARRVGDRFRTLSSTYGLGPNYYCQIRPAKLTGFWGESEIEFAFLVYGGIDRRLPTDSPHMEISYCVPTDSVKKVSQRALPEIARAAKHKIVQISPELQGRLKITLEELNEYFDLASEKTNNE